MSGRWQRGTDRVVEWIDSTGRDGLLRTSARGGQWGLRRLRHAAFGLDIVPELLPGEDVRVATHRHWVSVVLPVLGMAGALALLCMVLYPGGVPVTIGSVLLPMVLLAFAFDRLQRARKDVFVVTTFRVMRLSGVYSRKEAEMPLGRVLDITVEMPFWLRPLGAGHLILENAGQEQGLREVNYLPHPSEIKRTIAELHAGGKRPAGHAASPPAQHGPRRPATARYWRTPPPVPLEPTSLAED